jgi:hypothetical protein
MKQKLIKWVTHYSGVERGGIIMPIYASRLMKGHEVSTACAEFRDLESRVRRLKIKIVKKKKAAAGTQTA